MKEFLSDYITRQKQTLDTIPLHQVEEVIGLFRSALKEQRQIFVFGNGGSAANASHFVTDLGKGSSDVTQQRFRCLSLNDNTGWMTALGNDYSYEDVFLRQLMNFCNPGDLILVMSVSGNSPNLVKAVTWARSHGAHVIALVGGKRGQLAELAHTAIVVNDTHYGRVEDAHMGICHIIAYAFMEIAEFRKP